MDVLLQQKLDTIDTKFGFLKKLKGNIDESKQ